MTSDHQLGSSKDNYNAVGDVAGQYFTLKALLDKMPKDAELLCLGDPNDRGPRSKEVIEFLMNNGKLVNSNHAHLMTECWKQSAMPGAHPRYYEHDIWFYNGAIQTMSSYDPDWMTKAEFCHTTNMYTTVLGFKEDKIWTMIPKDHIEFLKNCPLYIKSENFVFTHAPVAAKKTLEEVSDLGSGFFNINHDYRSDQSLLWNRYVPDKPNKHLDGLINVFGHNSSDKPKLYTTQYPNGIKITSQDQLTELWSMRLDHPVFAICLDTSSAKVLTGLHLPTMTLYTQEYID